MTDSSERTFNSDFKRFFLRGLVVLLPTVLTLWILFKAYQFVDNSFAKPINHGLQLTMAKVVPYWDPLQRSFEPSDTEVDNAWTEWKKLEVRGKDNIDQQKNALRAQLRYENVLTWWEDRWYMRFLGLFVAIIGVYIAGRLLGGFFGRQIYRKVETIITSLPVFKQVYPYVKQVVDFLFSDEKPIEFNRVVVVEYPRKGIWSVGFQTGRSMASVAKDAGDSVTIFIPSSPTPFTGYTITVPRSEVKELPITVEEAIRFSVSGGVLVPDHQQVPAPLEATKEQLALASKPQSGNNDDPSKVEDSTDTQDEDQQRNAG